MRGLLALLVMAQLGGAAGSRFCRRTARTRSRRWRAASTPGAHHRRPAAARTTPRLHAWAEVGAALPQRRGRALAPQSPAPRHRPPRRERRRAAPVRLDYAELGSLPAIHRELRAFGVTHLGFAGGGRIETASRASCSSAPSRARDAPSRTRSQGGHSRPARSPPADPGNRVLLVSCQQPPATRLFALADVSAPWPPVGVALAALPGPRRVSRTPRCAAARGRLPVVCGGCVPAERLTRFTPLGKRGPCDALYVRSAPSRATPVKSHRSAYVLASCVRLPILEACPSRSSCRNATIPRRACSSWNARCKSIPGSGG